MKLKYTSTVVLAIAGFWSVSAYAANDYQCTIEKRMSAVPEAAEVQKIQEKAYIGKQFTVEGATGIMTGALQNAFTTDPEIIDDGSTGKDYKVVGTIKAEEEHLYGANIFALVIAESQKSSNKPFVFMENSIVFMGQCKSTKPGR